MILGALLALMAYTVVDILRARARYLRWSDERRALYALAHLTTPQPTDNPLG